MKGEDQTSQAKAMSKLLRSTSNTGMGLLSAAALAVRFVLSEPEPSAEGLPLK